MARTPTTATRSEAPKSKPASSPKAARQAKDKSASRGEEAGLILAGRSSVFRALVRTGPTALSAAERSEVEARAEVVINLTDKIDGLIESEQKLTDVMADPEISDPDLASARLHRTEAIAEREFCRSRIAAINHGGPFKDPGKAEEEKLLKALETVSRATATAAAISNLLQAVDGVIKTYRAQTTA